MSINLFIRPKDAPLSWEKFCLDTGPFSVALDGYVADAPRFNIDPSGPKVNLNHHENVSRLETRSTCAQVLMAIRQGFFYCFRDKNGPRADIYVNDCDEDVCLSVFLLKYGFMAEYAVNPLLNRLVSMEDCLDATAGAYPFPKDLPVLQELAWVFDPYRRFRLSGELDKRDPEAFKAIIDDVEHRIMLHITGKGRMLPIDTRYKRIGGGDGWVMIEEIGAQARTGAFADGVRAGVSVRQRPDGRWTYTIFRMSQFVPFDVPKVIHKCDEAEGLLDDHWGGGHTVGGSPRSCGSKLTPDNLSSIVEESKQLFL